MKDYAESREWPEYKTKEDFIRDAVYHRIKWAEAQKNRVPSGHAKNYYLMIDLSNEIAIERAARQAFIDLRSEIEKMSQEALEDRNYDELADRLNSYRERIASSDFPDVQRTKLLDDIDWWEKKTRR